LLRKQVTQINARVGLADITQLPRILANFMNSNETQFK